MSTIHHTGEANPTAHTEGDGHSIAVIAIHGVGQHPCGVSADAVSTLLLSLGRDESAHKHKKDSETKENKAVPPYSGFVATSIDVPLHRVQSPPGDVTKANDRHQPSLYSKFVGIFDERRGYLAALRKNENSHPHGYSHKELRAGEPDRGEFAYQFMLTQVTGYQGEVDRDFQTIRLEGERAVNSRADTVHIYDAHYSDLTKPESNILAFFFAFYQLLFHLASLSLLAVYWVEAENVRVEAAKVKAEAEAEKAKKQKSRMLRWRFQSSVHAISVRLLLMFVPILNLVLLEIGCCAFIDKARTWAGLQPLAITFAAVLSLVATFWQLRESGSPRRPFLWAAIPFLGTGFGVLVLCGLACLYGCNFCPGVTFFELLLLLDWLLAAGLLLGWVAKKFDQLRPGAFLLSILLYVVNVFWFLFHLLPHASAENVPIATATLWSVQWIFAELLLSWVLCLLSALISWPLSAYCKHGIENDPDRRARANAAFRTGRFAFAVPAILFVIVTCALWSGVVVYGSDRFNAFKGVTCEAATSGPFSKPLSVITPSVPDVNRWIARVSTPNKTPDCDPAASQASQLGPPPAVEWSNYLRGLLLVSVTPGLPITMAIFAVSLLLLAWAVLPSVVFELKPERTKNAASDRIRPLGEWLSRGLDNIAILTRVLWTAIVPIPLIFFVVDWLALHYPQSGRLQNAIDYTSAITLPLIKWQGLALAVSGAAVFAFILKYFTAVLDAILDVDNYLRIFPEDRTPRARIAERVTSLMRYIATYRDDRGRPYSKLIIVAHSLGSMVTTDLLRYLERSRNDCPDPGLARYGFRNKPVPEHLAKLPIYVFSMGSPLRQLLNRFFPHLYWWVSDVPDNSQEPLGPALSPPMKIASPLPRSDEMNVAHWSNAYRSGDYIGRWLWAGQWLVRNEADCTKEPPSVAKEGAPLKCDEMCIGLGAHTHYWDRSAPDIAKHLDNLIA